MGGSTNSGITSGLDQPRKQYRSGTNPNEETRIPFFLEENRPKINAAAMDVIRTGANKMFDTPENDMQSTGNRAVGGMSREDIAQTLFTQEQLAGATGEEAERRQKILDQRIAEVLGPIAV